MNIPFYRLVEVTLYSMLNVMPFLFLILYLFRRHMRFSRPVTIALTALMGIIQIGLGILTAFFSVTSEVMSLASIVVYAGFIFLVLNDNIGRISFVLLVFVNLGNLVSVCAKCLEGKIFGELAFQSYRWSMVLCMIVMHVIITIPVSFYVLRYFTSRYIPVHNRCWRFLWTLPANFYLIWYYHLYFAGQSSLEIALDIKNALFLLIVNLGSFVVYHTSVMLLITQDENAKLTQNNYLLTLQNVQYENLQQRIDEARRAKHDVRHHAHLTLDYLRSGKLTELEAYLEQYSNSLPDTQSGNYCQNYEVNTLLNYFAQQAQQYGITMDIFVLFPNDIALPETTLSVLLSNLLENAVDACKDIKNGEKTITVRGKVSDGFVYFDISNNFVGTLSKAKNGNYLTTKKHGKGLGLQSVSHLVKLHDGVFETDAHDNVFRVSVMLREYSHL